MKSFPTAVVSLDGKSAVEIVSLDGVQGVSNRDAVGYYFTLNDLDENRIRVGVIFSGTVMAVTPEAFGLPTLGDRQSTFTMFAIAALGDFLEEEQVPPPTKAGESARHIECFSPHFQDWKDRPSASDEKIEAYLKHHLWWAWKFGHNSWAFSLSDMLRLGQTRDRVDKLVDLGENEEWIVTDRSALLIDLEPTKKWLRAIKDKGLESIRSLPTAEAPAEETMTEQEQPPDYVYVDETRLADLKRLADSDFDLRKLIAICEELNQCYRSQCYHAVAALTRAVIDHVPPIFSCASFSEVANNYGGGQSFKACMDRLLNAGKKIADMHLHQQIRRKESLPTRTQVNFSNDLDLLLAEVVRILEEE